jgi:AraC-like DNA-binding protein
MVRPGKVLVLRPNTPCGIEPEGELRLVRVFYRPLYVAEQLHWSDPACSRDSWAALARLDRAPASQVVSVAGSAWDELKALADRVVGLTARGALTDDYWSAAATALRILGIVETSIPPPGGTRLFADPIRTARRPSEPCFGKLQALRPEVRDALRTISDNYAPKLTAAQLADRVGLSKAALSRAFTAQVGKTPKAYQDMLRVKQMAHLLVSTQIPVAAAVRLVGWANTGRAAQVFARATTMSPAAYRSAFAVADVEADGSDTDHRVMETFRLTFLP